MATEIGLVGALILAGLGTPAAVIPGGPEIMASRQELSAVVAGAAIAPALPGAGASTAAATAPIQIPNAGGVGIQAISVNSGFASANQSAVSVVAYALISPGLGGGGASGR
jgi:hypothetical protein